MPGRHRPPSEANRGCVLALLNAPCGFSAWAFRFSNALGRVDQACIYPAVHYVMPEERIATAVESNRGITPEERRCSSQTGGNVCVAIVRSSLPMMQCSPTREGARPTRYLGSTST